MLSIGHYCNIVVLIVDPSVRVLRRVQVVKVGVVRTTVIETVTVGVVTTKTETLIGTEIVRGIAIRLVVTIETGIAGGGATTENRQPVEEGEEVHGDGVMNGLL